MKLENIADIMLGRTFKHGIPNDSDWTHFVVQLRDINKDDMFIPFNWEGISRSNLGQTHLKNEIIVNDILIVAKGLQKRAVLIDNLPAPLIANQHFFILRIHNPLEYHPPFIERYLNSSIVQTWMKENSEGCYQNTMSKKVLSHLPIPDMLIGKQQGRAKEMIDRHRKITELQYEIEELRSQNDKVFIDFF